jgi:DMSO reductase anchor subunit
MYPAYSVIFFTVSSGAGYGLLVWLAAGRQLNLLDIGDGPASVTGLLALALVTAGLLSSTFHLGHPERAWRALSQWQTSWLSREGVLAIVTFVPALLLVGSGWFGLTGTGVALAASATFLLSLATVFSTAMIYAALTTIPRWANAWVPVTYVSFALASGGLLALAAGGIVGADTASLRTAVLIVLLAAWLAKLGYWRHIDTAPAVSSSGSATGLATSGSVRSLELPHTSINFVMQEMGYQIARKHARRLRRLALLTGLLVPGLGLLIAAVLPAGLQTAIYILTLLSGVTGVLIERWLFFAEAQHVATLYYGALRV